MDRVEVNRATLDASESQATEARNRPPRDRSWLAWAWYGFVRYIVGCLSALYFGWRATGVENLPAAGGVLLVSNHASHLDVFLLGIPSSRQLNYVARSTLFGPILGPLIRSVGGFPIQREGMGAAGLKETLKRLRAGGVVALFPEGTRTHDGEMAAIKPGIAVLVSRADVPVVPVGLAGTFDALPRGRIIPRPRPVWIHYGPAILPQELSGLEPRAVTSLIEARMRECLAQARKSLALSTGHAPPAAESPAPDQSNEGSPA